MDDSTLTTPSKSIASLSPSTPYYWRVNAKNSGGTSAWSSIFSFTTGTPQSVPGTPSLSLPADKSTNQSLTPTFSWNAVSNATTYRLQVSSVSTFKSLVIDDSTITSSNSIPTNPLSLKITYFWRVVAKNSAGWGTTSPIWSFTTNSSTAILLVDNKAPSHWGIETVNLSSHFQSFHLKVPQSGYVKIRVFGANGVPVLDIGQYFQPGEYLIQKNGYKLIGLYCQVIASGKMQLARRL